MERMRIYFGVVVDREGRPPDAPDLGKRLYRDMKGISAVTSQAVSP